MFGENLLMGLFIGGKYDLTENIVVIDWGNEEFGKVSW